jgi:uncharacterized protein YjbJ (UPF0337 family)
MIFGNRYQFFFSPRLIIKTNQSRASLIVLRCAEGKRLGRVMKKSVEDRMEGGARQAKGEVKQETGRIARNRSMQAKGFAEKHVGKAQRAVGRAKAKMENEDV